MKLSWELLELRLRHPFATSHGVSTTRRNVIVRLEDDEGRVGHGEVAPYYGESMEAVLRALAADVPGGVPSVDAALEAARLDLEGQRLGLPVASMLGGDPAAAIPTSFTIGQAEPAEIERKVREAAGFRIWKLKVGSPRDEESLRALRALEPDAIVRADANGGWSEDLAPARIEMLARHGVAFVEQPIPAGDPEAFRRLRARSALPIFADESIRDAADVERHRGGIDGIVVKLGKCGGIRRTLACIDAARRAGLEVMIGCMVESSAGITAAAHVASRCDHADLDGHLLVDGDPFEGVTLEAGALRLPARSGLGLRARPRG